VGETGKGKNSVVTLQAEWKEWVLKKGTYSSFRLELETALDWERDREVVHWPAMGEREFECGKWENVAPVTFGEKAHKEKGRLHRGMNKGNRQRVASVRPPVGKRDKKVEWFLRKAGRRKTKKKENSYFYEKRRSHLSFHARDLNRNWVSK